ncbi:GAF domain-containing protein [Alkalihalobacillus pseudalcaliphilus]|uniref:GAF domain-containing protein n=1 Tax=Alkalihalobacillus pseudalcaliphilus TaxID=79884 RepID=UPI00064DC613|nr:GAF domain-containing protein [Alkalihalobacillus pseudalcaliphilus]KMK75815.1 hypothetical protein AB990_11145 [Alkalihalobacillus pseudalcaliphilus]
MLKIFEGNHGHQSLVAVSERLFRLMTEKLDVNTAYIAKKDKNEMTVINSYNKNETIVPNNISVDYDESNCKLVLENAKQMRTFMNLMVNKETRERKITEELQVKAFIGVSLNRTDGNEFGTLCLMDKDEKEFTEEQIEFVQIIADVLSYVVELDDTYQEIELLSAPLIPISNGLTVLSLQGNINQKRGHKIIEDTLSYAVNHKTRYFIIDLSEIQRTDQQFSTLLNKLVSALKMMGVEVIFSGLPINIVKCTESNSFLQNLDVEYVRSIGEAFQKLGYELRKMNS